MKLIAIISKLFFLIPFVISAQDSSRRSYKEDLFQYEFQVLKTNKEVKAIKRIKLYWFDYSSIKETEYGYGANGKVLNGYYNKYLIKNNQILESGTFNLGLKNGEWKEWYFNGKIKKIQFWENGIKNGSYKLYNERSKLLTQGEFYNGGKQGEWIHYNGNKITIEFWRRNKLNGIYKEFVDGKLVLKGKYRKGLKEGIWTNFKNKKRTKYKRGKLIKENVETLWQRLFTEKKDKV